MAGAVQRVMSREAGASWDDPSGPDLSRTLTVTCPGCPFSTALMCRALGVSPLCMHTADVLGYAIQCADHSATAVFQVHWKVT